MGPARGPRSCVWQARGLFWWGVGWWRRVWHGAGRGAGWAARGRRCRLGQRCSWGVGQVYNGWAPPRTLHPHSGGPHHYTASLHTLSPCTKRWCWVECCKEAVIGTWPRCPSLPLLHHSAALGCTRVVMSMLGSRLEALHFILGRIPQKDFPKDFQKADFQNNPKVQNKVPRIPGEARSQGS